MKDLLQQKQPVYKNWRNDEVDICTLVDRKNYFLQDRASFLQVEKILQDSYKKFNSCKILGCNGIFARFLQVSCRIFLTCKNLARISFFLN